MSGGNDLGGSFSVDGEDVEVDLAEFGWPAGGAAGRGEQDPASEDDGRVRLQKALAHAGVASRRACEALITGGRVTVNGRVQRELGSRIDPERDDVRVDGVVVQLDVSKRYFVLNKPRGVVSTMRDENGRPDLREFTGRIDDRLYNVGRLDTDTSGLLILTNDGELAHKLAHPSFGVSKTYIAKVRGRVTPAVIQRLRDGVELSDGPIRADRAKLLPGGSGSSHSLVELTLHSGRNRIVRRMLAEVGHPVEELVRRQFGPLHLGTLRSGEMRELSAPERGALLSAAEDGDAGRGSGRRGGGSRGARGSGSGAGSGSGSDRAGGAAKRTGAAGRGAVTAGRPGDGTGARGMRGVAAKGNPHGRGGPGGAGGAGAPGGAGRADAGRGSQESRGSQQRGSQESRGSQQRRSQESRGPRTPGTDGRKRNGR